MSASTQMQQVWDESDDRLQELKESYAEHMTPDVGSGSVMVMKGLLADAYQVSRRINEKYISDDDSSELLRMLGLLTGVIMSYNQAKIYATRKEDNHAED